MHYYYVDVQSVITLTVTSVLMITYNIWYNCVKLVLFIRQIIENMQCENTLILPQIAMMLLATYGLDLMTEDLGLQILQKIHKIHKIAYG